MWSYDDGGWSAATWLLMCLLMVVFWGGLVALVVWLTTTWRANERTEHRDSREPSGRS